MPPKRKKPARRAPGEGGLFYSESRGMWQGAVAYHDAEGKRKFKYVYSKDRGKAVEKLDKLKTEMKRRAPVKRGPSMTLGDYLDHWLDNVHGDHVRQKTYRHYEGAIRLYIKPHIGHIRLDRLTADDVRDMERKVQRTSTRNAQKAHQALNMALNDAVPDYIERNVVQSVKKPAHLAQEVDGFELDVAQEILRAAVKIDEADKSGPLLATRWATAFLTGARKSELLGLTWDRVDWTGGRLILAWQLQQLSKAHGCGDQLVDDDGKKIPKAWPCKRVRPGWCPDARWDLAPGTEFHVVHRSLVFTRPKTKAGQREVPMIAPLADKLREHQEATAAWPNPHNLVWHYRDGRPVDPVRDREAWQKLMAEVGLSVPQGETLGVHRARHTAVTLMTDGHGVDRHVISSTIGHSKASTTELYQHVGQARVNEAFGHLADLLD